MRSSIALAVVALLFFAASAPRGTYRVDDSGSQVLGSPALKLKPLGPLRRQSHERSSPARSTCSSGSTSPPGRDAGPDLHDLAGTIRRDRSPPRGRTRGQLLPGVLRSGERTLVYAGPIEATCSRTRCGSPSRPTNAGSPTRSSRSRSKSTWTRHDVDKFRTPHGSSRQFLPAIGRCAASGARSRVLRPGLAAALRGQRPRPARPIATSSRSPTCPAASAHFTVQTADWTLHARQRRAVLRCAGGGQLPSLGRASRRRTSPRRRTPSAAIVSRSRFRPTRRRRMPLRDHDRGRPGTPEGRRRDPGFRTHRRHRLPHHRRRARRN